MRTAYHPRQGFSLVICLIILTLLSILVVSLISTATVDRVTSRAFANKTQAELAADTAVQQVVSLLAENFTKYPDSATVWEPMTTNKGTVVTEGTVLYFHDKPPKTFLSPSEEIAAKRYVLPLISRDADRDGLLDDAVLIEKKDSAVGGSWSDDDSYDLNRPISNADPEGWIGTQPPMPGSTAPVRKEFRGQWIDVKEQNSSGSGRVISRYAFWVEDESFKVNLNMLGSDPRGSEITLTGTAISPGELVSEIPIQGLLRSSLAPETMFDPLAKQAQTLRDDFFGSRLLDLASFNQPGLEWVVNQKSKYLGDNTKFLATIFSGGLNMSRQGSQRLNLNGLGFNKAGSTSTEIEKSLKQLVETIRYHAPKFYQRFYRLKPPTDSTYKINDEEEVIAAHEDPYLYKVAANIRDYIDPDLQPTIVNSGGAVAAKAPSYSASGSVWAQGKEGIYLQEAAVRERITTTQSSYTLKIDYYLEFWNMTSRDISALPQPGVTYPHALNGNPYVCIANQQRWIARKDGSQLTANNSPSGNPIQGPARDLVIDIASGVTHNGQAATSGVVFKAGQCTVITTDPDFATVVQVAGGGSPNFSGIINGANTYVCSKLRNTSGGLGKKEYTGPIPGPYTVATGGIKPDFRDGSEDYDTEVILGNDFGIIDSLPCAIAMGGGPLITNNTTNQHWYGGSLLGNGTTPSQLGDPRTNNEQLTYTRFLSGGTINEPDQSRFFNATTKPRFSLGHPNDRFVGPQNNKETNPVNKWTQWPDYYRGWDYPQNNPAFLGNGNATNPTEKNAPSFVAHADLKAIGQLGDIYDPARIRGTIGSLGPAGSRGGGRSFKIGQKDDLVDMTKYDAKSQQWAAWRLTDFMSTTKEIESPGLININGLRRDNGAALRAACYGMTLNSVSWPTERPVDTGVLTVSPAKAFDSEENATQGRAGLQMLINEAIRRLERTDITQPTYFRERGELSDLDIYSKSAAELIDGVKSNGAFDRTREELFRRLSNLITTRGNIFSVYAIGQSIQEDRAGTGQKRITGQHAVKVTFALIPKNADNTKFQITEESFAPKNKNDSVIKQRFAKPDHYDVLFLQVIPQ